ncbi:MAG: DUF4279 domain-containing protein [Planctomycetes bacterium]|nr:DUF4279 domain-containing protein [Planctomycetota bacterium]
MSRKRKKAAKRRRRDAYRDVFLELFSKNIDPDAITKKLAIQPDHSWRRGVVRNPEGEIVRDKNGKPRRWSFGAWILDPHVHPNAGMETRVKKIVEQIRDKGTALRQILREVEGVLIIVVEPHKDSFYATYVLPAHVITELTSLGIDIELRVHNPHKWDEFRKEVEGRSKHKMRRKGGKSRAKRGAK